MIFQSIRRSRSYHDYNTRSELFLDQLIPRVEVVQLLDEKNVYTSVDISEERRNSTYAILRTNSYFNSYQIITQTNTRKTNQSTKNKRKKDF